MYNTGLFYHYKIILNCNKWNKRPHGECQWYNIQWWFKPEDHLRLYHSPDYSYTVVFNVQSSIDFEKKKYYINFQIGSYVKL